VTGEAPRFTDEQLAELTPAELAEYERLLEAEERDLPSPVPISASPRGSGASGSCCYLPTTKSRLPPFE
jgi:hypothetical protein